MQFLTDSLTKERLKFEGFGFRPSERKEMIKIRPYRKSVTQTNGGYVQLWLAVIQQAVNDYRNCPKMRAEVERFLKSDYFTIMSNVSGQLILDRLKKEVKQNKR